MKYKFRLERCSLNGVKEVTDRLTALGGQGWRVVSTSHHGAELFVLMELDVSQTTPPKPSIVLDEQKRGPGRPKKPLDAVGIPVTSSAGKVDVSDDGEVSVN